MASPDALDSYLGAVLCTCAILIILSYITAVVVGFNRMSWVPLILSISGFIGNFGAYMCDHVKGTGPLYTMRLLAYLGWHVEESYAPFYSFFMLQVVLRHDFSIGRRWFRKTFFVWLFWALASSNFAVRIAETIMYVVWWGIPPPASNNPKHPLILGIIHMNTASYALLAATEILVAVVLIVVFHSAMKSSEMYRSEEKAGLFKRMAVSAEIRLASLAIIGITRAACSDANSYSNVAYGFHMFMWTAQHLYTVVLIMDLLIAKITTPRYMTRRHDGSDVTPSDHSSSMVRSITKQRATARVAGVERIASNASMDV